MISKTTNQFSGYLKRAYLYTLVSWLMLFLMVLIMFELKFIVQTSNHTTILLYFVPIFSCLAIVISYMYFNNKIKLARKNGDLSEKIEEYGYAYINKIAFLAGTGLFVSITYFLSKNIFLLGLAVVIFVAFIYERYSKKRMESILRMSNSEKESFNTPGFKIDLKNRGYFQRNPWALIPMTLFLLYLIYDGINGLL